MARKKRPGEKYRGSELGAAAVQGVARVGVQRSHLGVKRALEAAQPALANVLRPLKVSASPVAKSAKPRTPRVQAPLSAAAATGASPRAKGNRNVKADPPKSPPLEPLKTGCKRRPDGNKPSAGGGGASRDFVPWCGS